MEANALSMDASSKSVALRARDWVLAVVERVR